MAQTKETAARRLGLLDVAVLVFATGIGLVGVREYYYALGNIYFQMPAGGWTAGAIIGHMPRVMEILFPLLVVWTPAVLLLRLRRPRPALREVFFQPGASACGAVTIALLLGVLQLAFGCVYLLATDGLNAKPLSSLLGGTERFWINLLSVLFTNHPRLAATSIIVAWLLLLISGLWSAERSWVDRIGRIIGFAWLVGFVFHMGGEQLPDWVPSWFPASQEGFQ